jgi:ribonuclease P protein component
MLSKNQRLSAALLKKLSKERVHIVRSPLFSLRFGTLPPHNGTISRFNVVVSKKEAASAVKRNTLRRSIYKALLEFYPRLKPGIFGTVVVKKATGTIPYEKIREEIEKVLTENKLISKP